MRTTTPIITSDLTILTEMRVHLLAFLYDLKTPDKVNYSSHITDGRSLRVIVTDPDALVNLWPLHFVGFFGVRKALFHPTLWKRLRILIIVSARRLAAIPQFWLMLPCNCQT